MLICPPMLTCSPMLTCPPILTCPQTLCPAGYIALDHICRACPADTYKDSSSSTCKQCPSNTNSEAGSSQCTCEIGMYWTRNNCFPCRDRTAGISNRTCMYCPDGTDQIAGVSRCRCSDGSEWREDGKCQICATNTYKTNDTVVCQECPGGSTSSVGASQCNCPAGKVWKEGLCQTCQEGSISREGALVCLKCFLGSSDNTCLCSPGHYWDWDNQSEGSCKPCGINTYKTSITCQLCPEGATSSPGSSSCICKSGTYWNSEQEWCSKCEEGSASNGGGLSCIQCPGLASLNQTVCTCPDGQEWSWGEGGRCVPCSQDTFKAGDTESCKICPPYTTSRSGAPACVCSMPGFIWDSIVSDCVRCVNGVIEEGECKSCPEGSKPVSDFTACTCPGGYGWNKTRCELCPGNHYSPDASPICNKCPDGSDQIAGVPRCRCSDGSEWREDGKCQTCAANTYKTNDTVVCQECPGGSTSSVGASQCDCPAGKVWKEGLCQTCQQGSISREGALVCLKCFLGSADNTCLCSPGHYWDWDSQLEGSCKPCGINTYKTSITCQLCPGEATSSPGSSGCICKSGTYWDSEREWCSKCEEGSASNGGGISCIQCPGLASPNQTGCTCPDGQEWSWGEGGRCVPCSQDNFKAGDTESCKICPPFTTSRSGAPACVCSMPGFIWDSDVSDCVRCVNGVIEEGECKSCPEGSKPVSDFTACTCPGGYGWNKTRCELCPGNHYSPDSSPMCNKCPVYTVSQSTDCVPCKSGMFWNNFSCKPCNETLVGNGVVCLPLAQLLPETSRIYQNTNDTKERDNESNKTLLLIMSCLISVLIVICLVLTAVLIARKCRKVEKNVARVVFRPNDNNYQYSGLQDGEREEVTICNAISSDTFNLDCGENSGENIYDTIE